MEGVGNAHVAGVVGGEDELMPEEAEEDAGQEEVGCVEEVEEGAEDQGVAENFVGVGRVIAVI